MTIERDDEPTVEVTIGQLGSGEQTIRLPPGESLQQSFSEPSYIEVRALEPTEIEQEDTTIEQRETNDADREWDVESVSCTRCGEMYPKDYTRCPDCGLANQSA